MNIDLNFILASIFKHIEDMIIFNVNADDNCEFLDVLDSQLFLISDEIKKIIEKYDRDILFISLPLIDGLHDRQENYSLPIFEEIEALSDKSELSLDKRIIKNIILSKEKIKGKKIFRIKESTKPLIVVRLDVAESLLRRDFKGIKLERLQVEES
ncbi:hypothetical protein LGL08_12345 [Clostridium estertheticum]|nr:hypothetical protein [Clostridium estertheticum]MCB2306829.1 hypothetical protein [Clostridium estertheticum]MCB2345382.1 hypothetical protein [Clostridium estertheticum]MCB2350335.1 hypothetical protein [Clostridium estertheticum]WAG48032.1 hypothetical protein LL127_17265 [Clostridium estertheticum]